MTHRLLAIAALVLLLSAATAHATTYTVDSTADDDDATPADNLCATAGAVCTLRAAITEANAHSGVDTIHFPGAGITITLGPVLPVITEDLAVDGTGTTGTDCVARTWGVHIVIDDTSSSSAIEIASANVTLKGFEIHNTTSGTSNGAGIEQDGAGAAPSPVVQCVYSHGFRQGMITHGTGAAIGGCTAGQGVLFSGNNFTGLSIAGDSTTIAGSLIGTNAAGTGAEPNGSGGVGGGILVEGTDSAVIGGVSSACLNVIAGNVSYGVNIQSSSSNNTTVRFNNIGVDINGDPLGCDVFTDNGTSTTASDNTFCPPTPTPVDTPTPTPGASSGCCDTSGINDFSATCVDVNSGVASPQSQGDCDTLAVAVNETGFSTFVDGLCDSEFDGHCIAAGPSATPSETPSATNTGATATPTITQTPTLVPTPNMTAHHGAALTPAAIERAKVQPAAVQPAETQ